MRYSDGTSLECKQFTLLDITSIIYHNVSLLEPFASVIMGGGTKSMRFDCIKSVEGMSIGLVLPKRFSWICKCIKWLNPFGKFVRNCVQLNWLKFIRYAFNCEIVEWCCCNFLHLIQIFFTLNDNIDQHEENWSNKRFQDTNRNILYMIVSRIFFGYEFVTKHSF